MISVVGFLSRPHGYAVLKELIQNDKIKIAKIYTHELKPKSQDPARSIREDFPEFEKICDENNINLEKIDSKDFKINEFPMCDYIIEVSWRYFIPENIILKAKKMAFGIHRGRLPEYAGAAPIKQALLKNEKSIFLSVHNLNAKIDEGDVINEIEYPVNFDKTKTLDQNIQRIREEITPLFPKLTIETLDKLEQN